MKDFQVIKLLIQSAFLDLKDYVTLCWVLKKPKDWIEFLRSYHSASHDGKQRLQFWSKAIKSVIYSEVFFMRKAIAETEQIESVNNHHKLYEKSLADLNFEEINKFSVGTPGEIVRDVMRTFQTMKVFKEGAIGHSMLTRILFAVAITCPEVGYCQGMNFVAGTLIASRLNVFDDDTLPDFPAEEQESAEREIFSFMLELIQKNGKLGLQGLWGEHIPKLKLRVYQLDRLLRWNYPHLYDHFLELNLSPEVLTAQWFVTLFSYSFPLSMAIRLWDYICLAGWEGIFRIAVSILGLMQSPLLKLEDMESVAMLMKEWKKPGYLIQFFSFQELLDKASTLIINEEVLLKLQESFAKEILSMAVIIKYCQDHPERQNGSGKDFHESPLDITHASVVKKALPLGVEPPTFWLMRYGYKLTPSQATELANIYSELHLMDRQVDKDKQVLQNKILKACTYHQSVGEHKERVLSILSEITDQLHQSQQQFHAAVQNAQLIATKAVAIIETLGSLHPSDAIGTSSTNGGTANTSATGETSPPTTGSSFVLSGAGSFPFNILHEGPLRKLLFRRRYEDAKQITESLNNLIEKATLVDEEDEGEQGSKGSEEGLIVPEEEEDKIMEDILLPFEPDITTNESTITLDGTTAPDERVSNITDLDARLALTSRHTSYNVEGNPQIVEQLKASLCNLDQKRGSKTGEEIHPRAQSLSSVDDNGFNSNHLIDKGRRKSYTEQEAERERIAQQAKRLSMKIDRFASGKTFSSKSDRFSFSPRSENDQLNGTQSQDDSAPAHAYNHLNVLSRYARRWAPIHTDHPAPPPSSHIDALAPSVSIDEHPQGDFHRSISGLFSGEITHRLSSSLESIHNLFSPIFNNRSHSTSALPIKEIEEPTSSSSLLAQSSQLRKLEAASQKAQQKIISAHKLMEYNKMQLSIYQKTMDELKTKEEELDLFKKSLCDQLQLLVEDSNRGRSQKLLFVSESYPV